jgi:hypothetical protein
MKKSRAVESCNVESKAIRSFREASVGCKEIIRAVLREERDLQHLARRADIHARIYDHVRRLIK